jgi:hypothetical protein
MKPPQPSQLFLTYVGDDAMLRLWPVGSTIGHDDHTLLSNRCIPIPSGICVCVYVYLCVRVSDVCMLAGTLVTLQLFTSKHTTYNPQLFTRKHATHNPRDRDNRPLFLPVRDVPRSIML